MQTTMKDIARALNVSVSTVSRVLNGVDEGRASSKLREKILKYAEEKRYRFNFSARALKKGVTNSVGLVCPYDRYLFSNYTSEIICGILDTVNKRNYELLFIVIPSDEDFADRCYDICASKNVSGVFIHGSMAEKKAHLDIFRKAKVPFVVMNSRNTGRNDAYIDTDNFGGAYEAVEQLINLGHRKILHLMGYPKSTNSMDRFEGYKKALHDSKILYDESLVVGAEFIEDIAYKRIAKILDAGKPKFTAIFASNDGMAIGALRALKEKNYKVPGDISITGFDDIPLSSYVDPPLTTVSQNLFDIGKNAGDMLIDAIEDSSPPKSRIVPYKLVIRESTSQNKS